MSINIDQIKDLRQSTGSSMMACKKALEESDGDMQKAIDILRKKGEAKAASRSEKTTSQGIISSYIHSNNKIGVILKLCCETDFVAKNEEFITTGKDIAMHIAATDPQFLSPDEVDSNLVDKEKEIWKDQLIQEGKPEAIISKIIEGKEKKYREENALLTQSFVKNPDITIEQSLKELMTKVGENIQIEEFKRLAL